MVGGLDNSMASILNLLISKSIPCLYKRMFLFLRNTEGFIGKGAIALAGQVDG